MKYALVIIGIFLLALAMRQYEDGQKLQLWASANARGLESTVESITAGVQHSSSSYIPQVKYEYRLNGQVYIGKNIQLGEISYASRTQANNIAIKYPKNSIIDIYYDPFKPENSVIEPHINVTNVLLFGGSGLCFLFYGIFYKQFNSWILKALVR